jgi:tRNA 2-thiouridine synthesizing protein E
MELTADGFLKDANIWNEQVAQLLADDFILTPCHLEILQLLREFYFTFNTMPNNRALIKYIAQQKGEKIGNSLYLNQLFNGFLMQKVAKWAGLPKPSNCF